MSIEQQLADVVDSATALTDQVVGKMAEIDDKVNHITEHAQNAVNDATNKLGFMAMNRNHRLSAYITSPEANKHGVINKYPMWWGIKRDVIEKCHLELIPVLSGEDPDNRHPEARELVELIGMENLRHFSGGLFHILKITVLDETVSEAEGWAMYIADQHIKANPATTFLCYAKVNAKGHASWLGSDTDGEWVQKRSLLDSNKPGSYVHVDINFHNSVEVGDEFFLALPSVVPGVWPDGKKHGVLYNLHDKINERLIYIEDKL
ncbi:hypothetical protein [Veronia pacifica]|uniref:Uncharacterized protein n=1 Tax=Veronia pacifica TaxID=1080227 RepID=A0A1C3E9D3_9GAMM|nr:hypothetical protein [Veronia pacifica]ODA29855.1 hypothetical protein A8L45_21365 [Veronia pacifica]